jgi:hypothetical protein
MLVLRISGKSRSSGTPPLFSPPPVRPPAHSKAFTQQAKILAALAIEDLLVEEDAGAIIEMMALWARI